MNSLTRWGLALSIAIAAMTACVLLILISTAVSPVLASVVALPLGMFLALLTPDG